MPGFLYTVEKESGRQAVYITAVVPNDALALLALGGSLSAEGGRSGGEQIGSWFMFS